MVRTIAVIDYGLGNVRSVIGAIEKIGHKALLTAQPEELEGSDKLILPGVGAFGDGMKNLHDRGLIPVLNELVLQRKKPILGICLGSQLMAQESVEFGHHEGLGWINASVRRFNVVSLGLRVPHVGWNDLIQVRESPLFHGIPKEALFYYVHSFYIDSREPRIVIGEGDYGIRFASAVQQENIFATQFHPEKSQFHGLAMLRNFVEKI